MTCGTDFVGRGMIGSGSSEVQLMVRLALVLAFLADPAVAWQEEFAQGPSKVVLDVEGTSIDVFVHRPASWQGKRMIMVMHGTLRNADEYRDHAADMGERFGALIIAPRFDRKRFPNRRYHRGGLLLKNGEAASPEDWTWAMIPKIATLMKARVNEPKMPYWIIGHSAGGQFVGRMAAFQDTGAARLVAANPGSDLFPRRDLPFGYGFGKLPKKLSSDQVLQRYLAAPLTFYLGTADNAPDKYFDTSDNAMKQGKGRLQRGHACFKAGRKLAKEKGWTFNWRVVDAQDVGHDHQKMFDHAACEKALFR